jgi:hypothetical protein
MIFSKLYLFYILFINKHKTFQMIIFIKIFKIWKKVITHCYKCLYNILLKEKLKRNIFQNNIIYMEIKLSMIIIFIYIHFNKNLFN